MGNKVDYRPENKKKLTKYLKIAVIVILALILIYLVVQSLIRAYRTTIPQDTSNSNLHYKVDEYEDLQDLLNAYGCTYISETSTSDLLKVYVKFDRDLYTDGKSNENFFNKLIKVIAEFENFKNFELIDESRNIDILITCENKNIVEIKINDDINYFLNKDSDKNSNLSAIKITNFTIQSQELLNLIDNDWLPDKVNFGSKDSTCDGYDIYFEEGIKLKTVGRKAYNLIFTEKYTNEVCEGLGTSATAEEIVSVLGEPTFKSDEICYGYLGEKNYLFFDFMNNQISVYPVLSLENEEEFINLINSMNETSDIKQFAMDLTSLWTDYDIYDFNSNYVNLQYTLRGIKLEISSSSLKNGIYIYQNYIGDLNNLSNLDNVYIQDKDIIFEEETKRIINYQLSIVEQGNYTEEELSALGESFSVRFRGTLASNESGEKGPTFYSRDGKYADTELEETLVISSWVWYDDYNFIYSVNNDGIYLFNPVTNVNIKILEIEGEININSAGEGKIVYNDTQKINITVE